MQVHLARHTNSGLFGTFAGNNMSERAATKINDRTHSVWAFLNAYREQLTNDCYTPSTEVRLHNPAASYAISRHHRPQTLNASGALDDMHFWHDVYAPDRPQPPPLQPVVDAPPATNGHVVVANHDKIVVVAKQVASQMSDLSLVDNHADGGDTQTNGSLVESVKKEEEKCCS